MDLKPRHYWIIGLVIATAFLHFGAALDARLYEPGHPLPDLLFTLNGLGYLGLLLAYFVPVRFLEERHGLTWWILFLYIIVTILAWVAIWVGLNVIVGGMAFFGPDSLYGVPAKIAEVILLFLLWRDRQLTAAAE
ncbi:MAG: hypothetical protein ACK2T0_04095 [Anaerolineales bacterium]|jgi:hypothetical protein